jgi:hypothetical protein
VSIFTQIGGARLGHLNASYPFATLSLDSERIHLTCLGRKYDFPRSAILKLRRHRGLFSLGLAIEHTMDSAPHPVIFWTGFLFHTRRFQMLKRELEQAGYEVID